MPEMNRKLDRFAAAILDGAAAETERTAAALRRRRQEAMTAAEDAALRETYQYIHDSVARIKAEAGREVSMRMQDNKRTLYLRRSEIAAEVFDAVRLRIADYTAAPAYRERLCALLQEALDTLSGAEELRIYLRSADRGHAAALAQAAPGHTLTFLEGGFQLGGLIAEAPGLGLRCDASFDSALDALDGHFAEIFGLSLSDVSDEP